MKKSMFIVVIVLRGAGPQATRITLDGQTSSIIELYGGQARIGPNSDHLVENNYAREAYYEDNDWFMQTIATHGAHPYMNLVEGNVTNCVSLDNTWGSSSHNTFLRNHFTMHRTAPTADYGIRAVDVEEHNYYHSFIGNVAGDR